MTKTVNKIGPRDIEVITEVISTTSSFYNYDELIKLRDATKARQDQFNEILANELANIDDLIVQCKGLGIAELAVDADEPLG